MDLANGDIIYIEARTDRTINLEHHVESGFVRTTLSTEEARTLATALLAAVVEAEAYR